MIHWLNHTNDQHKVIILDHILQQPSLSVAATSYYCGTIDTSM